MTQGLLTFESLTPAEQEAVQSKGLAIGRPCKIVDSYGERVMFEGSKLIGFERKSTATETPLYGVVQYDGIEKTQPIKLKFLTKEDEYVVLEKEGTLKDTALDGLCKLYEWNGGEYVTLADKSVIPRSEDLANPHGAIFPPESVTDLKFLTDSQLDVVNATLNTDFDSSDEELEKLFMDKFGISAPKAKFILSYRKEFLPNNYFSLSK